MPSNKTTSQREELHTQLRTPLDALRAALESIANDLEGGRPHLAIIERGIDQTVTLSRRIQNLIDEIAPLEASSMETAR